LEDEKVELEGLLEIPDELWRKVDRPSQLRKT
jgi:hypothetical protein